MFLFEPELGHAEKDVTQFSAEEREQFKLFFTKRQSRRWWFVPLCYLGLLPAFAISVTLAVGLADWLTGGIKPGAWMLFLFLPVVIGLNFGLSRLTQCRCPSCATNVDHTIGPFCPCCGTQGLIHYGKHPACPTCKAVLKWNRWIRSHPREFKLHACSVCGVWLSDKGV